MSHLGRPKDQYEEAYSLKPVAQRLSQLIHRPVHMMELEANLPTKGQVSMLENLRFWPGEKKNDQEFAQKLARFGDIYVNDAFGAAHRAHASIDAVARLFPVRAAGFLLAREVHYLRDQLAEPKRPYVAIMGGSKVSDKIGLIKHLMPRVDTIVVGGAMSYTFLSAQGVEVGDSRVETSFLNEARDLMKECEATGVHLLLPLDHVVATAFDAQADATITLDQTIQPGSMGLDIGPETIHLYLSAIKDAGTIVWNGPMGVFEWDVFSTGTISVAEAMAEAEGLTIVGGGDSAAAVRKADVESQIDHISTGGGAALELLSGIALPGLVALEG